MISQMLLLVIATAACVNAYPHGDELAKGLSVFLDQLIGGTYCKIISLFYVP